MNWACGFSKPSGASTLPRVECIDGERLSEAVVSRFGALNDDGGSLFRLDPDADESVRATPVAAHRAA
jgi:hypothetical protein